MLFVFLTPCVFQAYGTIEYQMFGRTVLVHHEITDALELQIFKRLFGRCIFFHITLGQDFQ